MESLIKCGAFDCLKLRRSQLLAILDQAMERGGIHQKERRGGQLSFFEVFGRAGERGQGQIDIPPLEEWPESQLLAFEKAVLGFYLTGHPLSPYESFLSLYATTTTKDLKSQPEGVEVTVGGVIARMKVTTTKKGNERMAILGLEDFHGSVEVLVFPKVLPQVEAALKVDAVVLVSGRASLRDERPKLLAQEVIPLEEAWSHRVQGIQIRLTPAMGRQALETLKGALQDHPGKVPVELAIGNGQEGRTRIAVGDALCVQPSADLFRILTKLVGPQAIAVIKNTSRAKSINSPP
jgi:DNA polymerase-3 subunit alpha